MLDVSRCRLPPFEHQVLGTQTLIECPFFLLADEMGAGKTKQVIDAAQILFTQGIIDRVLVIAPASVRPVWFDQELGELAKHLWFDLPSHITEFHSCVRDWRWAKGGKELKWVVSNYEFIRSKDRLEQLKPFCTSKTFLVLDESSAIKNHRAEQTKACLQLRRLCGRVVLLNGTPIANSPLDMFAQGNVMHPRILDCKTFFHFRNRYAIMGGWQGKVITGWQNLNDLQQRFKPYVLRRLKKDCLDLPEAMPPVTLTVTLTDATWAVYKEMRDEMVAWLNETTVAVTQQAAVKAIRLAQITSGFVGGVESQPAEILDHEQFLDDTVTDDAHADFTVTREVGREKLDFILAWHRERLIEDPNLKLLVWCRFRPELDRLIRTYLGDTSWLKLEIGAIYGGQKRADRDAALRLLDPRTAPQGPVFFGATQGTGALGHNFTACHTVVNLSSDFSLFKYLQAAARVDRPGQTHAVSYFDIVAQGPKGQKTIDHAIVKARREKANIAEWTTFAWVRALTEE